MASAEIELITVVWSGIQGRVLGGSQRGLEAESLLFIFIQKRTQKLRIEVIAHPRVHAALTSPYFWSVGAPNPPTPGSAPE